MNYSATVMSSLSNTPGLSAECMSSARFFIASVAERNWCPRICVVRQNGAPIGIVCAKERKVAGLPCGLLYADATLDQLVIAAPGQREKVLEIALSKFIQQRGVLGFRLSIPDSGYEQRVIGKVLSSFKMDASCAPVSNHSILPLADDYNAFLENLGSHSRRNFRYYRRRFEALGHRFVEQVPLDEFADSARRFQQKSVTGSGAGLERGLSVLAAVEQPILAGLRTVEGELMAILGGWYGANRATVFMQLNNEFDYDKYSLCTVLRAYLIELLISRGIKELVFWGGVGAPLSSLAQVVPAKAVYLDKPTLFWRSCRSVVRQAKPFLSAHAPALAAISEWVVMGNPEPVTVATQAMGRRQPAGYSSGLEPNGDY